MEVRSNSVSDRYALPSVHMIKKGHGTLFSFMLLKPACLDNWSCCTSSSLSWTEVFKAQENLSLVKRNPALKTLIERGHCIEHVN